MSGQLYAPGVPQLAEEAEMQQLVDTYGKTWHTWQVLAGQSFTIAPVQFPEAQHVGQRCTFSEACVVHPG